MERSSKLMQFIAASSANLSTVAGLAALGWSSPILARLKLDPISIDNPLGRPITDVESSWIGSIVALGAIFGSILAGGLTDSFGRKKTIQFSAVPYLIGWAFIATATSVTQLYIARFIFGVALSICFTAVPMYCGEIAETSIRGVLGSFLQLFNTFGLLYAYIIGPYVSYTTFWIVCAILPIIFFLSLLPMPESPYFLIGKNNEVEASRSLAKLRGKPESAIKNELEEIQMIVEKSANPDNGIMDLFTVKANVYALSLACALVIFQQSTGILTLLVYAETIFESTGTNLKPEICTIIIGLVQMIASSVTPLVVDRLGRRILLIFSGLGTAITMGALGLFFYAKSDPNFNVLNLGWLPVSSLIIFMFTYCLGWGPLPWAIMGELFPSAIKTKASGITVLTCWSFAFLYSKYFNSIEVAYGTHIAFWIFSVASVLSIIFTIFLLPETKGKSLSEIQDELSGRAQVGHRPLT